MSRLIAKRQNGGKDLLVLTKESDTNIYCPRQKCYI